MQNNSIKNIGNSTIKSLAVKGGTALFIRHLLGFAVNFSCGIILARFLGPEIMGMYFISVTVISILRQLIDFGLSIQIIRMPHDPLPDDINAAFTIQQLIAITSTIIVAAVIAPFTAVWYGHRDLLFLVGSAGICAYFNSIQSVPFSILERKMAYRKIGAIEVSEIVTFNVIAVAGAIGGFGIWGLAIGNICRGIIPAVIAASINGLWPSFSRDRHRIYSLTKEVSPLAGSNVVLWIIMLAPVVVVGKIAGTATLAVAQLTYSVLGNTTVIATIFQRVGLVSFAKLHEDEYRFNNAVQRVIQILYIIYIPLTMGIASLSPWWVGIIYGEKWSGIPEVMLIAAIPVSAAAILSVFMSALLSKGLSVIVLKQNTVHAVLYWLVMLFTSSLFGAKAVPMAHITAMAAGYIFIKAYKKYCGRFDSKPLIYGFVSGVIVMCISWIVARKGNIIYALVPWAAFFITWMSLSSYARETVAVFYSNIRGTLK